MTPQNNREIIRWLEMLVIGSNSPKGWPYSGMGDFILKEGYCFDSFSDKDLGTMEDKQCFANALIYSCREPERYVYVEGYACSVIPMAHAWVYDRAEGKIIDPTWSEIGKAYCGVPFDPVAAQRFVYKTQVYGLIDCYSAGWPLLSGEVAMDQIGIANWRIIMEMDYSVTPADIYFDQMEKAS